MTPRLTDAELLKAIDDHTSSCNTVEADMLDSMMKQVDAGRALTERQRAWLEKLLSTLDERS